MGVPAGEPEFPGCQEFRGKNPWVRYVVVRLKAFLGTSTGRQALESGFRETRGLTGAGRESSSVRESSGSTEKLFAALC